MFCCISLKGCLKKYFGVTFISLYFFDPNLKGIFYENFVFHSLKALFLTLKCMFGYNKPCGYARVRSHSTLVAELCVYLKRRMLNFLCFEVAWSPVCLCNSEVFV